MCSLRLGGGGRLGDVRNGRSGLNGDRNRGRVVVAVVTVVTVFVITSRVIVVIASIIAVVIVAGVFICGSGDSGGRLGGAG
jgi:hypothetical protein